MIAWAASSPPPAAARAQRVVRRVDAGEHLVAVVGEADQAGGADDDVDGADAEVLGDPLGDGVGGQEAVRARCSSWRRRS